MAIEELKLDKQESQNKQVQTLVPIESVFQTSNIWMAGTLKIRNPLIDESFVLFGFIGKCPYLNYDNFSINGMTIRFFEDERNLDYSDNKIYTKVLADFKMNYFYELFPQLESIKLTDFEWLYGIGSSSHMKKNSSFVKENYYFFESYQHLTPSEASSEIYLVCKYKKDDKTKYAIFAPHEVLLEQ